MRAQIRREEDRTFFSFAEAMGPKALCTLSKNLAAYPIHFVVLIFFLYLCKGTEEESRGTEENSQTEQNGGFLRTNFPK